MSTNNFPNLVSYLEAKTSGNGAKVKQLRDTLVMENINLIRSIAYKYQRMSTHLDFNDLVNEGVIGLMQAIDRYNPARGYEFSTYATWWVRRDIMRALSTTGRTIRVPERVAGVLPKLQRATINFIDTFGFAPDPAILAENLGRCATAARAASAVMAEPALLINEHGEPIDLVDDSDPLDDQVILRLRNERIRNIIQTNLTDREATIITGRFGLGDDEREHTLEDLGEVLGLSRERVRQLETLALEKLRVCMKEVE